MDRLDAMQVLLAVVDEGSLSAGSRKLRAPLPSVSRKVAELEHHLGTRLLIRTSRNIQLTDAGRDYVAAARQIVAEIHEAEQRASGEYQMPRGELRITASIQLGQAIVAPLAWEFLREFPEITLNTLFVDRQVQLVEENVDLAVRVGSLDDSSLYGVNVGSASVATCASPDYVSRNGRPERPEDLCRHDAVIFGQVNESPWRYLRDGIEHHGMPRIRARVNMPRAAVSAAVQGLGLTRLFNFMMTDELRSGALVRLFQDYDGVSLPVHLVYVRQGLLPLKVRTFLDWMTPRLRKMLKQPPIGCPD
jgi:DNA-binding transcriptional LysR family regulator